MATRPSQGGSAGTWGSELNTWLDESHNADGSLKGAAVRTALGGSISAVGQNIKAQNASTPTVERFLAPAPIRRLHSLFAPLVCDLGVGLRPNGNDYELLFGFGSNRYWRCLLALETGNPGSYSLHQIQAQAEVVPMVSVDGADASVARGAGVTGPTTDASAYSGHYYYGVSSGQTFTISVPSSTRVGWRGPRFTNGGLAIVSIDSDKTLANLLPTAQDVVDSGAYPNTILVANGGPCATTDRVLDTYAPVTIKDDQIALADNLSAGTHTVVLTPVGTARSVGGGTRVYFSGYGYATASTTLTDSGIVTYRAVNLNTDQSSAWEYAFKTGGTFFGNVHGYDVEDSISVTVDGSSQSLTAGQRAAAVDVVEITRTSHLVDPAATSTTIANVTTLYHLDRDGLRVDVTVTWAASKTITAAYVMAAMNGVGWGSSGRASQADTKFDKGSLLNYAQGPITFVGASDAYTPSAGVKTEAAWICGGNYGLFMWLPNVSNWTNSWTNSGIFSRIEDRASSGLYVTKIYVPRIWADQDSEAVVNGDVWSASTLYLVGRFPNGAAATVAA